MKQLTIEWIEKAEGAWDAAQSLYRVRKHSHYSHVCFHTQQCAEKYLRAWLQEADVATTKVPDLTKLFAHVLAIQPNWTILQASINSLAPYSSAILYPGQSATKDNAKVALANCREVRRVIRLAFNLPV